MLRVRYASLYRHSRRRRPPVDRCERVLTLRESEVAVLVANGLTNKEIASQLVISERTVDSHVSNILSRLGANRRVEIAAFVATLFMMMQGWSP